MVRSPNRSESKPLYACRPSTNTGKIPMNANYTTKRDSLIQMFLDASDDEVYADGRLYTRRTGENTVELIAYLRHKIAEYDESTNTVTIFAGHEGNVSPTVTKYVRLVREMAGVRESRTMNVLLSAAPNVGDRPPAEAAKFINNYKSFSGSDSSVERWATETVNKALRELLNEFTE